MAFLMILDKIRKWELTAGILSQSSEACAYGNQQETESGPVF